MTKMEKSGFPDAVQAAPKTTKVLYENDKIRVLEERFTKGQRVPMHSHPPHFAYAVTRMKFRLTFPDGKAAMVNMKKGDVGFSEEIDTHAVENYLPGIILVVETK
jgi:oxalate decarboxylase/phosphoglucose isomerase-like protein (cupin superfamily)